MRIEHPERPLAKILLTSLLALGAISQSSAEWKTGEPLPNLAAFNLEGKLPEYAGKVVLVDFWASWCAPCAQSFPAMESLQKKYADKGFQIIAINVDENRSAMDKFLKKTPATFSIVRDAAQKLVEKAGVSTMPGSFLVDRAGKVSFVHTGFHGKETEKLYEQEIETLLKQ